MARFPTQLGNVGSPRTQLGTLDTRQPASAFGVGVGIALQQTGQDLQQFARAFGEENRKHKQFLAQTAFTRWAGEQRRGLEQAIQEAPPGAPEFTNSYYENIRKSGEEFLSSIEDEEIRQRFMPQVEAVTQSVVTNAFSFEMESRRDFTLNTLNETVGSAVVDIYKNPANAEAWAPRIAAEVVDASGLSDTEKEAFLEQSLARLDEAMFYGELNTGYGSGVLGEPGIVATDAVPPVGQAFLNAVAGPESAGRYNVRFDGSPTGALFEDMSDHPRVPVKIPEGFAAAGQVSTAAGRYMITATTWDEFAPKAGVTDFSERSQDLVAWEIAKERYAQRRPEGAPASLEEALAAGETDAVKTALASTWEGIGEADLSGLTEGLVGTDQFGVPNPLNERFSNIEPERRLVLFNQAKAEGERRRREAQREYLKNWENDLAYRQAHGEAPENTEYTTANITRMFSAEEAAALVRERDRALEDGKIFTAVASATPEELAQMATEAEEALANPEEFKANAERAQRLNKAIETHVKALNNNAPGYIAQTNPTIGGLREIAEQDTAAAVMYGRAVLDEQARLGVPQENQHVLDKGWASSTVRAINEMEADARGQAIRDVVEHWGDFAPQVLLDLEEQGLSPHLYFAGLYADQPGLSHEIAAAVANYDQAKARLPSDIRPVDVENAVRSTFAPFNEVFGAGDWTGQASERINEMMATAQAVVTLRAVNGEDYTSAARAVYEEMIEANYKLLTESNIKSYVPNRVGDVQIDANKVSDVANFTLSPEVVDSLDIEPFGVEGDAEIDEELTRRAILDTGFWVTNSTADGLMLMVPFGADARMALPVRTKNGNTLEMSFEQMMATNLPDDETILNEPFRVIEDLFGRVF